MRPAPRAETFQETAVGVVGGKQSTISFLSAVPRTTRFWEASLRKNPNLRLWKPAAAMALARVTHTREEFVKHGPGLAKLVLLAGKSYSFLL